MKILKRFCLTVIFLFVLGFVIGTVFANYLDEVGFPVLRGLLIGTGLSVFYVLFTLTYTEDKKMNKWLKVFLILLISCLLWVLINLLITNEEVSITWWMQAINSLLAVFTVWRAISDGKKIANKTKR